MLLPRYQVPLKMRLHSYSSGLKELFTQGKISNDRPMLPSSMARRQRCREKRYKHQGHHTTRATQKPNSHEGMVSDIKTKLPPEIRIPVQVLLSVGESLGIPKSFGCRLCTLLVKVLNESLTRHMTRFLCEAHSTLVLCTRRRPMLVCLNFVV
jgi:hypothetical protein